MPRSSDEILALKERVQELEQQYAAVKQELSEIRKLLSNSFDCSNQNTPNDIESNSEDELTDSRILLNERKAGFRTAEQARRKTKRVIAEARKTSDVQALKEWYEKVDSLIDERIKYGISELRILIQSKLMVRAPMLTNQPCSSICNLNLPYLISKTRNELIDEIVLHYQSLGYSVTKTEGTPSTYLIISWK